MEGYTGQDTEKVLSLQVGAEGIHSPPKGMKGGTRDNATGGG